LTPTRNPEITATFHEFGVLSVITTDHYFVFLWVAIVVVCLTPTKVVASPFPRWFGYFSAWCALIFECGAVAFLPRSRPFAWNGLLAFWLPFCCRAFRVTTSGSGTGAEGEDASAGSTRRHGDDAGLFPATVMWGRFGDHRGAGGPWRGDRLAQWRFRPP
jgi:hypothetical protein